MKTYQYRLYPKQPQKKRFQKMTEESTGLWNFLLKKSNEQYRQTGKGIISWYQLQQLCKEYSTSHLYSQTKQDVSRRLAKSFQLFFSKLKKKQYAKPPRFKKESASLTYPQSGFKIVGNKLWVSKLGNIPIVLHRSMSGDIKTLTIKKNRAGQYHAFFSCDIDEKKESAPDTEVGIDVGIERFATFSDGTIIENPRFLSKRQRRLKKLQRSLSRKKKGSNNRQKAKHLLAVAWQHYDDTKRDFLHKQTTKIVSQYRMIAVEDLNIKKMLQNGSSRRLHRSIAEASWNKFVSLLDQKAIMRSGRLIRIDPYNTSQICSGCGNIVKKPLGVRMHECSCGLSVHRDLNAAINIADRAGLARIHACGDKTSVADSTSAASPVMEARTKTGAL
jgi:putative transposase